MLKISIKLLDHQLLFSSVKVGLSLDSGAGGLFFDSTTAGFGLEKKDVFPADSIGAFILQLPLKIPPGSMEITGA